MTTKERLAMQWIAGDDTGTSSETIWSVMTGVPVRYYDVPYDPDDFGRCYRLLVLFPEWKNRIHEVAAKYPGWKALIRELDTLETMFLSVISGNTWNTDASQLMYDFMKPLIEEGRKAATTL